MKIHPAAKAFPELNGQEFEEFVDDIRENGQRVPVVFHGNTLLDGRNRIRACERLGLDYEAEEWDGKGSAAAFVASMNIHRRHLTASQRAMVGAEMMPEFRKEAKARQRNHGGTAPGKKKNTPGNNSTSERAREAAASAVGVSDRYIDKAEKIKKKDPELAEAVKAGKVSITKAAKIVDPPKKTPKERAKAEPGRRWYEAVHKVYSLIIGSREAGGIQIICKGWTKEQTTGFLGEVREVRKELQEWEKTIRGLLTK